MNEAQSQIIDDNPIGSGLDAFRTAFRLICESKSKDKDSVSYSPDTIDQLDQEELQNLSISLLSALQILKASRLLPSTGRGKNLFSDLSTLNSSVNSDDFDPDRTKPLLKAALASNPSDTLVWKAVYRAVIEPTPPPRPIASSVSQTPTIHSTSGFANSSEYRLNVDKVLKEELGPLYVGIPQFIEHFFGHVAGLETAAEAALKKCTEGSDPLLGDDGWVGWPKDANQDSVLKWFTGLVEKLERFAEDYKSTPTTRRRLLGEPDLPMQGSKRDRKMDVGIVDGPDAGKNVRYHWSQILVAGELKSNPSADTHSKARLDLGRYAREVLAAQDTRRYVLGFTLCGSLMRIWIFDRLGGIASEQFDIHEEALQFVSTILGFLWMSYTELGFDPTILTVDGQRVIEIERDGKTERLVIDELMRRASSIVGRATTCWKAHPEGYPQTPLVIKDSWQYPERVEEGELLQQATENNVVNVARHYFHETVQVLGIPDDIWGNVRKGLDITTAENYRSGRSAMSPTSTASTPRKSRSIAGVKRSSSQTGAILPASKRRSGSASPTKVDSRTPSLANRIHRRVILRDYGKPIYEASSRRVLLQGLEGCVKGHQSLYQAGFLHRDISINNLVINEDPENPSWPSFLIDLDLGIKEARVQASGARGKTGTKVFMAIGALQGEQHTFMHDLESFFWVLFWICIHYEASGQGTNVPRFDKWNYADPEELAEIKKGLVSHEGDFMKTTEENFTPYYQSLTPWVNRLRQVVFPGGRRWEHNNTGLYSRMTEVLREAWQDREVSGN